MHSFVPSFHHYNRQQFKSFHNHLFLLFLSLSLFALKKRDVHQKKKQKNTQKQYSDELKKADSQTQTQQIILLLLETKKHHLTTYCLSHQLLEVLRLKKQFEYSIFMNATTTTSKTLIINRYISIYLYWINITLMKCNRSDNEPRLE